LAFPYSDQQSAVENRLKKEKPGGRSFDAGLSFEVNPI
jgi:hypothetical protein